MYNTKCLNKKNVETRKQSKKERESWKTKKGLHVVQVLAKAVTQEAYMYSTWYI